MLLGVVEIDQLLNQRCEDVFEAGEGRRGVFAEEGGPEGNVPATHLRTAGQNQRDPQAGLRIFPGR